MSWRWLASGIVAIALLGLGLAGCGLMSETLRYRVTVVVDTPAGVRTGSSVWEVVSTDGPAFPGPEAGSVSSTLRGEAVAVDLPQGTLFALMRAPGGSGDYAVHLVQQHLAKYPQRGVNLVPQDWRENRRRIQKSGVSFDLAEDEYPLLVRFRNISDPRSVEKVDPANLAEAFGPGVRLRRITIKMTSDPVTTGIEARFPWWKKHVDRHFDGSSTVYEDLTTDNMAARLSVGSFTTEKAQ
jgi:hypothetical protein